MTEVANCHLQWTNQIFNLYLNGCWLKMSSWGRGLSSWGRRSEWRANSRPIHSSPPTPPPLSTSSTSLHVQLSALSLCSFLSIYSFGHFIPPLPPPTQLLSFTCFNSLSESLSSYRLGTWSLCCQPDFKVCILMCSLLRPHFFVSSPLKQISRSSKTKPWRRGESRLSKEIVLITAENGKQSEMSRPVLTILKYYKLQLQTARAMPAMQVSTI